MKKQMATTLGIGAVIIFALIVGLAFLGWQISGTVEQIQNLRSNLTFYLQITESLSVIHQNINLVQPYAGEIDNALPTRDQLIKLPGELSILAQQNSVIARSELSGDSPKEQAELKSTGLTINVDGIFDNLVGFLKSLESSRYSIRINSFDLVNKGGDFKSTIGSRVFYF